MKKEWFLIVYFLTLSIFGFNCSASILTPDKLNSFSFTGFENWVDDGDGSLDTGDYFEGIFNTLEVKTDAQTEWISGFSVGEFSGTYKISVVENSGGKVTLGQSSDYFRLYYSDSLNWDGTLANVVEGDLWLEIAGSDIQGSRSVETDSGFMQMWGNISANNTGFNFLPVFSTASGSYQMESKLGYQPDYTDSDWMYITNDPFFLHPTSEIPEPSTVFLFGIGLLGIAGISRKRRQ